MAVPASRYLIGPVPWYSALIVCGAALAVWLSAREEKRLGLPKDTVIDLALRLLPFGILGARLYYVLFSWDQFRGRPLSVLYIWEGGLAIYGGLIAGILTLWVFCRRRNLSLLTVLDLLVPGVALAQAIGRWGNYFNMEAYGIPVTDQALQFFPFAVQIPEGGVYVWHAAAFFYESFLDFLLFLFLLYGRRKLFRRGGDAFLFYAVFYAAFRLCIENLRMDSLYLSGGIRVSQLFSALICLAGILLLARRRKDRARAALFSLPPLACGIPVLLFMCGWRPGFLNAVRAQMCLLILFCLLTVLSCLLLYGRGGAPEVFHADHDPEESDLPGGAAS